MLRFDSKRLSELVVILGGRNPAPLDHLVTKRLIPPLPETVIIHHYSYLGSWPQGKLGPFHPERVKAWDADFARIAGRARNWARDRGLLDTRRPRTTANRGQRISMRGSARMVVRKAPLPGLFP